MKVYIITREDLNEYTSTIVAVRSDKNDAKKIVDDLNRTIDEDDTSTDYRLQSFTVDGGVSYD